jgi:hypothetical protein
VIPFETVLDNDYFQSHKKLQYYHIYQKAKTATDGDGSFWHSIYYRFVVQCMTLALVMTPKNI